MTSLSAARRVLTQVGGACRLYCGKIIPARKASHDAPSHPPRSGPGNDRRSCHGLVLDPAVASCLTRPRPRLAPHAPPAWFPTNVARNSHVNLSNLEIASLRFCGFLDALQK